MNYLISKVLNAIAYLIAFVIAYLKIVFGTLLGLAFLALLVYIFHFLGIPEIVLIPVILVVGLYTLLDSIFSNDDN